jgi:hypothetical protein
MWLPWSGAGNPKGKEATAPLIIRKIQKVQRGKEMPPDGGIVFPEDAQMKPFFPKSYLNSSLNVRVLVGAMRFDGFRGGHADLNGGHLGLMEYPFEGVMVLEVPSTPFGPEVVEDKTTKDV